MFFEKAKSERDRLGIVIPAAGSSMRMGGENKLLIELDEAPVIAYTLTAFEQCDVVQEIVLVARECDIPPLLNIAKLYDIEKLRCIVKGGDTRQQSVQAGVMALSEDCRYIGIHDGARPFVTDTVIESCLQKAKLFGCAAAGVPVKDTVKIVSADGVVLDTPDRSTLYAVQTPQIFRRSLYLRAAQHAVENALDFTDDCQLLEAVGEQVHISPGDYRNIKITTAEDVLTALAFIEETQ